MPRNQHIGLILTIGIYLSVLTALAPAQADDRATYSVAVVPQFNSVAIHNFWSPLLAKLSQRLGVNFELKSYASIPRFEADLFEGGPDLAFMNPYHAVIAHKSHGYIPLVRDSSKQLKGILVVRKESPFKRLQDLDGSELVFPAPNAFGASLYMRALLTEKHKLKFSSRYVRSHGNVYRNVILGKANAGGGVERTLKKEPAEIRDELRLLFTTPGVAPHPLAIHPRVPESIRAGIVNTILELAAAPDTRQLLIPTQLIKPIAADYERDYLPLEVLGLDGYVKKSE